MAFQGDENPCEAPGSSARVSLVADFHHFREALTAQPESIPPVPPFSAWHFRKAISSSEMTPVENPTLKQADAMRDAALENPLLTSRHQMLDRALELYERVAESAPDDASILSRRVSTRYLSAGKSNGLLSAARDAASGVLERIRDCGTEDDIHARAVCELVLGNFDSAENAYSLLSSHPDSGVKTLARARHLARHLALAAGLPRDRFDSAFPPLRLVVFSGHLPPRAGRHCLELIEKELTGLQASIGVASAAAGADLLFLDALQRRVGSSHIILPWSRDTFRETSVRPYDSDGKLPSWEQLFDSALASSESIREIGEISGPDSHTSWQYLLEVSAGIAVKIAREKFLDIVPLAFWDGKEGGPGGTSAFCEFWKNQLGIEPRIISCTTSAETGAPVPRAPESAHRAQKPILQQAVKSMLFIDVVGFSRLPEAAIPAFVEKFLQKISEVVAASSHAPHSLNTWGDALYAVFDFVRDAGLFALELNDAIEKHAEDWEAAGLGRLRIRTGLHAGPVFLHHDPIVRRLGFSGAHVNRAARIEPVAGHGEIFASEEFSALAAITPACGFTCEFAVTKPLAKNYPGLHHLYRVIRDRSADLLLLAQAIHEDYCAKARAYGETPQSNAALIPWDKLPPGLQSANLAQAEDIPRKLRQLGYEIVDTGGIPASRIELDPALVEPLAILEHDRWMAEKVRAGWTFAEIRDNERLHHPLLVPYDDLAEVEKEKDRVTVRNIPALLATAGYRVEALVSGHPLPQG